MAGNLAAVTGAIGEEINVLVGYRFTRLRSLVSEGETSFPVETAIDWPAEGTVVVGTVVYNYTSIGGTILEPTLEGITYDDNGSPVAGAAVEHQTGSEVLDFSRTFSALDILRMQFFVNTAEGNALSIIGRDLGIPRAPGLSDDDIYRDIIKALAYASKGTIHAMENALTVFFGANNFEILEDLENVNNTVFIRLTGPTFYSASEQGRAFLSYGEPLQYNSGTQEIAVTKTPIVVEGVRLKDENQESDVTAQFPTDIDEVRYVGDAGIPVWSFNGTGSEGVQVTNVSDTTDGDYLRLNLGIAANAHYSHLARIRPESDAYLEIYYRPKDLPSGSYNQWQLRIQDGVNNIAAGVTRSGDDLRYAFIDAAGAVLSGFVTVEDAFDRWQSFALRKNREDQVELLVDDVVIQTLPLSSFPAVAANAFIWGDTTTGSVDCYVKTLHYFARTTTDYWNTTGDNGATLAAAPTNLDTQSGDILAGDVGKPIRIFGSGETNAEGGNNNFQGLVATATAPDDVTVVGEIRKRAFTEGANPSRIQVAAPAQTNRAFLYPDDLGKTIELITGSIPGPHVIDTLLDPVTLLPLTGSLQVYTDVCEVAGAPGFSTETDLDWRLRPVFVDENPPGSGLSWELSGTGTVGASMLKLRTGIPLLGFGATDIIVDAIYTVVRSAQALGNTSTLNNPAGSYYPFYLGPNPLGPFAAFLDELTVAGVIPEVSFVP